MKKKKNKTHQVVTWPTATLFTIKELHRLNQKFVEITLRVRLIREGIEAGRVAEIGSIPGDKGRPQKVFSMTPVTKLTLERARDEHINLVDNADKLVQYISVTNPVPTLSVNPAAMPVTATAMVT